MLKQALLVVAFILALRLPVLHQAIQGDEVTYLTGAQHAQIEPLHPTRVQYMFQGVPVDMRGHPHPPLNVWMLGGLLAAMGDIREARFHAAYILFSLIAGLSMLALARKYSPQPLLATFLFLVVPAFVINGSSLETDVPFLAFWMACVASLVYGYAAFAALAGALACLCAYQGVFLTPILAVYLWRERRDYTRGWLAILAGPLTLAAWQLFERSTGGQAPAGVLAGYLSSYGYEAIAKKFPNALSLTMHLGWMVSPLIVWSARAKKWQYAFALAVFLALITDPLLAICVATGVFVLATCIDTDFFGAWVALFFVGALVVFFAGAARYLLPIAAPVAILISQRVSNRMLIGAGLATQFALGLALSTANYQHWAAYRKFAESLSQESGARRVWINADLGLRYYLEMFGGVALPASVKPQPGEMVVTSDLTEQVPFSGGVLQSSADITPSIPLRLISVNGTSSYSAIQKKIRPFEISSGPLDRVRAEIVAEPTLSIIDPRDPKAASQLGHGVYPDGWMGPEGSLLLKLPPGAQSIRADFFIPQAAPGRHVSLALDGKFAGEETYKQPGSYSLTAKAPVGHKSVGVTLQIDRGFSAPPDVRELGLLLIKVAAE